MNHLLVVDDSLVDRAIAGKLLAAGTNHQVEYSSNGLEALEHLEARLPLAVITDMQMPEMDGIELVKAIRQQFSSVPVVLMTGCGSEEIAMRALMLGAADYVPKSRLKSDLVEAVKKVLAIAAGDRPHEHLSQCLRYQELHYELDNDVLLIPPVVEQFQRIVMDLALTDVTGGIRLAKALVETLSNAIYHGNLQLSSEQIEAAVQPTSPAAAEIAKRREQPPYRDLRVFVKATFSPEEARITIRDEGPGFDVSKLPDVGADPSHLTSGEGRGLVLVMMFMDEVTFNPAGNEITMVKRTHHTNG
jgi:CheY-like chemotaxis protein/anti-sigma regulatory factor (Ser/Thr protein kinase)